MGRHRIGFRPDEADIDKFSIQRVLSVELAPAILELADLRRDHGAVLAVRPVQAPLLGLRVVGSQGKSFDAAADAVRNDLLQRRPAVPDLPGNGSAVKFDPGGGARQGLEPAFQVNFPTAKLEIKIVLAVANLLLSRW